eukprot:scaffold4225_cov18-Prasinocladus_malaysianus.AAC.2
MTAGPTKTSRPAITNRSRLLSRATGSSTNRIDPSAAEATSKQLLLINKTGLLSTRLRSTATFVENKTPTSRGLVAAIISIRRGLES